MKLRLSTLLMIIAIMFFSFYYINYAPQVITPPPQPPMPLFPPMEEGVTIVDEDIPIENFGVTFLDRDDSEDFEEYQYSGNVRPDNVMYKDDRTFNI